MKGKRLQMKSGRTTEKCWKSGQKPCFCDRLFLTRKCRYGTLKRNILQNYYGIGVIF